MIARSIDHRLFKDVSDTEGTKTETRREEGREDGEKERGREREREAVIFGSAEDGRKEGATEDGARSLAGAPTEQRTPLTTDRLTDRPMDVDRGQPRLGPNERGREAFTAPKVTGEREREREREREGGGERQPRRGTEGGNERRRGAATCNTNQVQT